MTRKEAIKILQDYPNCTVGQLSEVPVKAVLEFMETIPHWISVEDDFPKKNDVYLCYNCVEDEYEILLLGGGDWWDGDGHCVTNVVTHWMPLPQPPRKEE